MSTYYTEIDQATSELTHNSVQQYPIFRDLFYPITIEALYFVGFITIAFLVVFIFLILVVYSDNKENNLKKLFHLAILFLIFLFSASHIAYLTNILTKKVLTDQSIGYLMINYEYASLSKRCNNPKLIELSKTNIGLNLFLIIKLSM